MLGFIEPISCRLHGISAPTRFALRPNTCSPPNRSPAVRVQRDAHRHAVLRRQSTARSATAGLAAAGPSSAMRAISAPPFKSVAGWSPPIPHGFRGIKCCALGQLQGLYNPPPRKPRRCTMVLAWNPGCQRICPSCALKGEDTFPTGVRGKTRPWTDMATAAAEHHPNVEAPSRIN